MIMVRIRWSGCLDEPKHHKFQTASNKGGIISSDTRKEGTGCATGNRRGVEMTRLSKDIAQNTYDLRPMQCLYSLPGINL